MKWTPNQIDKLKKLCFEGKPNAEIANIFDCDVKDIHAARSRLGITIPKVKEAKAKSAPKKPTDPWPRSKLPLIVWTRPCLMQLPRTRPTRPICGA